MPCKISHFIRKTCTKNLVHRSVNKQFLIRVAKALPVIGTHPGTALHTHTGKVVDTLLSHLTRRAREQDVDLVLVCGDDATF